jgi:protein subunit release factor A
MVLKDIKIEFFKSRGPGGQHKNKRHMAARVTHLATGLSAVSQEYRSQTRNRETAIERLSEKLEKRFKRAKPRIRTKKPKVVKERILEWKRKRKQKKVLRRKTLRADEADY